MPASDSPGISLESAAVIAHIHTLQAVIARMAQNSTSSKTWAITLAAAILVVIVDHGRPEYALIALIPNLPFFCLDAYYLSLERAFRRSYQSFIERTHEEAITTRDLYAVRPQAPTLKHFLLSCCSISVLPFYGMLLFMILLVALVVITPIENGPTTFVQWPV